MAQTLDNLIQSIPVAVDGAVIDPRYHNSLRSAMEEAGRILMANQPAASVVVTVAPQFSPVINSSPPWSTYYGQAVKPVPPTGMSASDADGWMAIPLPDGMRIQKLVVYAKRTGKVSFCSLSLQRQPFESQDMLKLMGIDLSNENLPVTSEVFMQDTTPEDVRRVNNAKFKYLIRASLSGAESKAEVTIQTIQVVCTS